MRLSPTRQADHRRKSSVTFIEPAIGRDQKPVATGLQDVQRREQPAIGGTPEAENAIVCRAINIGRFPTAQPIELYPVVLTPPVRFASALTTRHSVLGVLLRKWTDGQFVVISRHQAGRVPASRIGVGGPTRSRGSRVGAERQPTTAHTTRRRPPRARGRARPERQTVIHIAGGACCSRGDGATERDRVGPTARRRRHYSARRLG